MARRGCAALSLALALWWPAGAAMAQVAAMPRSPVLMLDSERLFAESDFGARVAEEIQNRAAALAAENRGIEADLEAEELALTERRDVMAPDAFRAAASAFDEKVTRIRREQEEKARGLGEDSDAAQRQFLSAIQPVLGALMRESGAAMIFERRTIYASRESVDITDLAIARIDAAMVPEVLPGDGQALSGTVPEGESPDTGIADGLDPEGDSASGAD